MLLLSCRGAATPVRCRAGNARCRGSSRTAANGRTAPASTWLPATLLGVSHELGSLGTAGILPAGRLEAGAPNPSLLAQPSVYSGVPCRHALAGKAGGALPRRRAERLAALVVGDQAGQCAAPGG